MVNIFKKLISWINRIITFFSRRKSRKEYEKTKGEVSFGEKETAIKEIKEIVTAPQLKNEVQEKVTVKSAEEKVIEREDGKDSAEKIKEIEERGKPEEEFEKVKTAEVSVIEPSKIEEKVEERVKELTEEIIKEHEELGVEADEDKVEEKKPGKPRKKKLPTEQREKRKKSRIKKKESSPSKEKQIVDLGKAKRKTPKVGSHAKSSAPKASDDSEKSSLPSQSVLPPYIEINFDNAKVFLVLPKQVLNLNVTDDSLKELEYGLEINGKEEKIIARGRSGEQTIEVEEKRIEIEKPIRNFTVIFPEEINGRTYKYAHKDKAFYVFISSGDSGKMHYLFDENGNMNPLPKRDVWLLLNEDFELSIEPELIEERWIWEKYRPLKINLKEQNELIIIDRKTRKERAISCEPTFTFDTRNAIFDDFGEQLPIFIGNNIRIIAPKKNSSGWLVWIQNKIAGSELIRDCWTGDEPLILKLPDDLPCECGEFQIDICEQKGKPIATLFFRHLPSLQLQYPKELMIPEPRKGHEIEKIEIILENLEDFELKTSQKVNVSEQGFCIAVPPENDTIRFSISQKDKPETKVNMQITLPRLRWRSSQGNTWEDKPLQIKREGLIPAEDFYLFVRTNSPIKYDILAILESDGNKIQESRFTRGGMDYSFLLNQFYDTIKKNEDKLTLRIGIAKDKQTIGETHILYIPEAKTIAKEPYFNQRKTCGKPIVKGGKGRFRIGKGFSKGELLKAGIEIKDIKCLNIPYDKRRKTIHQRNVETLKVLIGGENNGNRSD